MSGRGRGVKEARERFRAVLRAAKGSEREGCLYLALAAGSRDPRVADFVRKVSQRRLDFLSECYRALGLPTRDARKWATFAYSTFLGTLQLRRDNPSALPPGAMFNEYLRLLIETLIPRSGEQPPAANEQAA